MNRYYCSGCGHLIETNRCGDCNRTAFAYSGREIAVMHTLNHSGHNTAIFRQQPDVYQQTNYNIGIRLMRGFGILRERQNSDEW